LLPNATAAQDMPGQLGHGASAGSTKSSPYRRQHRLQLHPTVGT